MRGSCSRVATFWRWAPRPRRRRFCPAEPSPASRPAQELHGLSAFGDLKYGPDFTHFDYVNIDAPKGGTFNFSPPNWGYNQNTLTFNTLNSFTPRAMRRRAWRCASMR